MGQCKFVGLMMLAGLVGGASAVAVEKPPEVEKAKREVYRMWNVQSMMLQSADNIARRYNLNKAQAEYTRKMLVERVTQFLDENQEAMWPLVRDLARHQINGQEPDPQLAKRIGESALPLVEKARQAIIDANKEWGKILSPEQQKLHEFDLREMNGTFEQINSNFGNWKAGNPTPNPMFPTYQRKPEEPRRPRRPASRYTPRRQLEHSWDRYVKDFIRKYKLDPGQQGSANSILAEQKKRAATYRTTRKHEYQQVDKKLKEAFSSGDLKKRAAVEREEVALNRPIDGLFKQLQDRLGKLPTAAQKRAYEESRKAKRSKSKSRSTKSTAPKRTKPTTGKGKKGGA